MREHFVIGSRGSKLALWQSEWVKARLEAQRPEAEIRIEVIKTSGDVMLNVPLAVIGGKGVFTKELEEALLAEEIDLAVHSLKDLPTTLPDNLAITAITEREDARDALILREGVAAANNSLRDLPQGAIVGTSSLRRQAQLKHLRPDVSIKDLRGNVDTRLRKLDEGGYDAIILASAGLRRLGFERRIDASIDHAEMLPAVGQGALGIETRAHDPRTTALVSLLEHPPTRAACTAERALLFALGGGCQVPIAAHAVINGDTLRLDALVAALDGSRIIRDALEEDIEHAARAGETLAARLRERGAEELLEGLTV
ncbi:MAG TPA: hydroxymethylbilane synthase [Pyrinomonadaceae bacterium]|jgi:hydroxymethylbilane synthase|nr:hydroxymethylbilane synthase [Pyrinomonadaceae bacterium]